MALRQRCDSSQPDEEPAGLERRQPGAQRDAAPGAGHLSFTQSREQTSSGSGALSNVSNHDSDALRAHNFNDTANRRKAGWKARPGLMEVALYYEVWDRFG
ncbi:hypothetical protein FN846DRAFT_895661 [Sphaerosporella brunnea]|uniref:Uncharacterized protein n=1 Tax=Sphaerosporella brunnea TaxID=1250544 RepID=A0A5J5EEY5_9PEZI|nr:hypothetical protein FN846DRAFT_895661 [Sphaerosporella brunnea]